MTPTSQGNDAGRAADQRETAVDDYDRGCVLAEQGLHRQALDQLRRAAADGHLNAHMAIGNSLRALDLHAQAVEAYAAAEAAGDTSAALNLGLSLEVLGDLAGAEEAWRRAQSDGDPKAVHNLAWLLRRRGDAAAAAQLGVWMVSEAEDDPQPLAALDAGPEVEALLRRGAAVDGDAVGDLAWMLRRRGQVDEAEALLRDGHARGVADCAIKLSVLLEEDRGDLVGAEGILRVVAGRGELFAWNNLGLVLREQGRLVEAEEALRRGAAGGDVLAGVNLRRFRRDLGRQLGRAHRRARRLAAAAE